MRDAKVVIGNTLRCELACVSVARRNIMLLFCALLVLPALLINQEAIAQTSTSNHYRVQMGWGNLPEDRTFGVISGVFPDPDGEHLWFLDRCGDNQCAGNIIDPILKFDLQGNLVDSFGGGMFAFPHGFALDHEGYLWVTEGGSHGDSRATLGEQLGLGHQVLKLNKQGEVLMRLGEAGVWGDDESHFNGPSGVAIAENGDIWVTDGHRGGNNRLMKFSADGEFLMSIGGGVGSESKEAASFSDPHDVKIDANGRVLVADRGNSRIQVFNSAGELQQVWTHYGKPSGLFVDHNNVLYVGDGLSGAFRTSEPDKWRSNLGWERGIRIGSLNTEQAWVTHFIPQIEESAGAYIEFLGVDFNGHIYSGEVGRKRMIKFVPFRPPEALQ
jgi:DNA-binding beta-propeller fold protein YncE